ncbi:MAG: FHA domain-containing protein [Gammaproteobacteria bacterium]
MYKRRKGERRQWTPVKFPLVDNNNNVITQNRRRNLDRRSASMRLTLTLTYRNEPREFAANLSVITVGRSAECDLTINNSQTSRVHAKIERRGDVFVITDSSRNGTYVKNDDEEWMHVEDGAEKIIWGKGVISLGRRPDAEKEEWIHYVTSEADAAAAATQ